MGRNGAKPAIFPEIVKLINSCEKQEITLQEILLGKEYGRNAETSYVYSLIKLGYLQIIKGSLKEKKATLKILRHFTPGFSSMDLKRELRSLNYDKALKNNEELLKKGEVLPLSLKYKG